MNLKTLKAFLHTGNGLIYSSLTQGCKLFIKHDLNVVKWNDTFFYLHCGKHPVIFITFKKITGNSFNDVLGVFRGVIHESYLEHEYLLNSTWLDDREQKCISLYTDKTMYKNVTERKLKECLVYLSEMLYIHFNKKIIVSIDDIDAPVLKFFTSDFSEPNIRVTLCFIREFILNLLENKYVEKALILSLIHI